MSKQKMTPQAAQRIQSSADRGQGDAGFKARAAKAAAANAPKGGGANPGQNKK